FSHTFAVARRARLLNLFVCPSHPPVPERGVLDFEMDNARNKKARAAAGLIDSAESFYFFRRLQPRPARPSPRRTSEPGSGSCNCPRISPPWNSSVWKLMYERPARILSTCCASVVPLPSSPSHVPAQVPPTPVAKGVQSNKGAALPELVSLKGAPKKP